MTRKVYRAHLGFYDTIVAAPSQASALAAWGSRQNLFRIGLANVTDDPDAIKTALSRPGVVLRRPFGSTGPFSEHPPLPEVPQISQTAAPTRKRSKKTAGRRTGKTKKRSKSL